MSYAQNSVFYGHINGVNPTELLKKIDYNKNKIEDRLAVVNDILDSDFYTEYFDEYYKVNINSGDSLSEYDNACNSLEKLANYLLNADEVKEYKKQDDYIFYSDEESFRKALAKEVNIEGMGSSNENVIHFLKKENRNHKKPKVQSINKKDLERDDFLGEVLNSYKVYLDSVTEELKNSYKESMLSRYKLSEISGSVKRDMIISKDMLTGVFGYKTNAEESTVIDWDFCDLTNPEHVKALLYMKPGFRSDEDLMYLIMEFVEILELARPTKLQKEIIMLMRENKGQTEISLELGIPKQNVNKNINMLVNRICKCAIKLKQE